MFLAGEGTVSVVGEYMEFGPGLMVFFYRDDDGKEIVEIASNYPSPVPEQEPCGNVFMPLQKFKEILASHALRVMANGRTVQ